METMEQEIIDEELELKNFNEIHEEIKANMARTPPISIIKRSITMLHNMYHSDWKDGSVYVPWIPLALIEWSLVYGARQQILLTTEITDQGYNKLYNLLHSGGAGYESKFLQSGQPFGLMKFMRCMAHQQFWFQGGKGQLRRHIGRNLALMSDFNDDFLKLSGLSIEDFNEMLFMCFAHFQKPENGNNLSLALFRDFREKYTEHQIEIFFSLTSLTLDELQTFIREHHKHYEKYFDIQTLLSQMTPLWRFPFIKENEKFVCIYPSLIEYALKYFIYDYLKCNLKQKFSSKFGTVMENHVARGLKYLDIQFLGETEIQEIAKHHRPKKSGQLKCVDFIVPQKDGILLIESKAHETPLEVRVNPANDVLAKHFPPDERHVFHGIVQAFELCDFIAKTQDSSLPKADGDFYLLLVTYKDFFLGRGKDFWEEFVREAVKPSLDKKGISEDLIKPENIFVISLDEYDMLINQAKESDVEILDIIRFAIEQDQNGKTQKMIFGGHTHSYNPSTRFNLPYLEDGFQKITNSVIKELQKKHSK